MLVEIEPQRKNCGDVPCDRRICDRGRHLGLFLNVWNIRRMLTDEQKAELELKTAIAQIADRLSADIYVRRVSDFPHQATDAELIVEARFARRAAALFISNRMWDVVSSTEPHPEK